MHSQLVQCTYGATITGLLWLLLVYVGTVTVNRVIQGFMRDFFGWGGGGGGGGWEQIMWACSPRNLFKNNCIQRTTAKIHSLGIQFPFQGNQVSA